jgi:hypothetical protein
LTVTGVQAIHNGFGISVDTTGGGTISMMIDRSTVNENTTDGLQALGANTTIQMSNSMFSHNNNGWNITAPAGVFSFVNNIITQNTTSNLVGTLGPSKTFQ